MEIILEHENFKLVKRYNIFYINVSMGKENPFICEIKITNQEALKIITNKNIIKDTFSAYKTKSSWTKQFFINEFIKDYLHFGRKIKETEVSKYLDYFNSQKDIVLELYNTLITGAFPETNAVNVKGYTAKSLNETTNLDVINSYSYLIYLRKNEKRAIAELNKYKK